MKRALFYTLMFVGIQLLGGGLVALAFQLLKNEDAGTSAAGLIVTTAAVSVVTIVVFLAARWTVVSRHWVQTRPWFVLFWCVLAALGVLIPSSWLQEQMPVLPNFAEETFDLIMKDRMGYFIVGLLAPLSEELVFRGAVLKALLQWKQNPWVGIVISAVLFALIHMNPVQMPHAFLVGLLLGWMYYRTDSIVPGVVYHWVNNTVAYVMYNLYPDPDMTLLELFGSQRSVLMALVFSLCIFLPALYQLNLRLRK
jgi:hypothetical protein